MSRLRALKWLRDTPISRKLYFTVGIMALLIMVELGTLTFAIHALSSVRALVGAEGLWSKAQKDAAYHLQKYGRSHNEQDYTEYLNSLSIPLGDRKTRSELMRADPDLTAARQGFIEGHVHPDDIDGSINLFRRFHSISYISKAITVWGSGDTLISELMLTGDQLHKEITATKPSAAKIDEVLNKLDPLNERFTNVEDEFSFTLGEGSRWLEHLILRLLFGLVLTVEVCGLTLTILVSRGISKGLNEIIGAADKIAKGNLKVRAERYSSDEIGILATAFNEMTHKLEQNINALKHSEENLKASKKVAEQSVVVKENFLANMSHEIRTPMNALMGFTTLLENTALNSDQQEILHSMKVSGNGLMALINDILDYSKIESGMIIIENIPFTVRETFESLQVILTQKAKAKDLTLQFYLDDHIPNALSGDPTRLMQILLNLADNAIKFTEDGSVDVSAKLLRNEDADVLVEFVVTDTGKGIPADKQAMIFERFTQVSASTNRKYGGTGLGLSIAKSLVELQNGTLSLTSEAGKGSTFSFAIPYKRSTFAPHKVTKIKAAEMAPPPPATVTLPPTNALRILVAEDNPINQKLVTLVLKKFGMISEIAENGRVAVDKIKEGKFDLVLMDIQMPEMDGYQATTIIRKELKSDIPIIALTAHAMNEEKEKCLGLGMNEFISKPFEQTHLHEAIMRLCAMAA